MSSRPLFAALLAASISLASAQDGGALYGTYCSACHGVQGEGATGGTFPPLSGSEWIEGSAERAISVVLKGLTGPVEVAGKEYNLMMPPQGAILPDDQIAAILTYVRSSWDNNEEAVTPELVTSVRASLADRAQPWTQDELLALHPFPQEESALRNLISRTYHGEWKKLPDFDNLEPVNYEEEHDGILSLKGVGRKEHFGVVWEGEFVVPKDGSYVFRIGCDDGGRLIFNNEVILEVHGLGGITPARTQGSVMDLKAGTYPMRIDYYQNSGTEGIALTWRGPDDKTPHNLSDVKFGKRKAPDPIPIEPTDKRATIYRNFIENTTDRVVGIGLPSGVNFAYSSEHLAPELLWTGAFLEGSRHWANRGQGKLSPLGENLVKVSNSLALPAEARYRGYRLDPAGNPTFKVTLDEQVIEDGYRGEELTLIRTLQSTGGGATVPVLLGEDLTITTVSPGVWQLADGLQLEADAAAITLADGRLTLALAPDSTVTLTYRYASAGA